MDKGHQPSIMSVLWSMTWKELKDSMDEQNMLNMLINSSPYYNPMVSHMSGNCRSAPPGIVIGEEGRLQEVSGGSRHVVEDE